jgi:hypothetical protein
VTLAWSRGVTPKLPTITTDADGAFRVQVLVFHNDIVGARDRYDPGRDRSGVRRPSGWLRLAAAAAVHHLRGADNPPPAIVGRR